MSVWAGVSHRKDRKLPSTNHADPPVRCLELFLVVRNDSSKTIVLDLAWSALLGAGPSKRAFEGEAWDTTEPSGPPFLWLAPQVFQINQLELNPSLPGPHELAPKSFAVGEVSFAFAETNEELAAAAWASGATIDYVDKASNVRSTLVLGSIAH